mgnify:CR=1 FL=1
MNDEELAVLALAYGTPGLTPARLRAALDEAANTPTPTPPPHGRP